jgi:hypothetical protein
MAMVTSITESEPSSYEEAASQQVWREAMVEEYVSIMKNDVWEVVPRPEGKSVVISRWLYKIKHAADGSIEKYKARFVARGFSQVEGVDYDETSAPVARYSSIRSVVSIATEMGWKIHQMDVKTAFLNGVLDQEVYVEQPLGFVVHERETHVCRLKRALYGLKQAPRAWYSRIDTYLLQIGFTRSESDVNLYYIVIGGEPLILVLYVDDLFITGAERLIEGCKRDLACYPRYLGITRRSCLEAHMVLDMEYREQERPEHGPGGPIFFFSASFVLSAVPASITTGLVLHRRRLLLHEVIGPRYHGMCHI